MFVKFFFTKIHTGICSWVEGGTPDFWTSFVRNVFFSVLMGNKTALYLFSHLNDKLNDRALKILHIFASLNKTLNNNNNKITSSVKANVIS